MSSLLRLWEGNNANNKLPYSIAHSFNIWTKEPILEMLDLAILSSLGNPLVLLNLFLYNSIFNAPVVFIPSPLRIIEELRSKYSLSKENVVIENKESRNVFFSAFN